MKIEILIFLTTSLAVVVTGASVREIEHSQKTAAAALSDLAQREQQAPELIDVDNESDETNIFEKKYFDILPNDLYSDEDAGDVSSKTSNDDIKSFSHLPAALADESAERRVNSRRFRRDSPDSSSNRQKRQNYFINPYPLTHSRSIYPQYTADFFFPQDLQYINQPFQRVYSRQQPVVLYQQPQPYYRQAVQRPVVHDGYHYPRPSSNPFYPSNSNNFHKPGNFYLPPSSTNNNEVNQPFPPDNQLGEEILSNRLFGFEGIEDKPVWNSQLRPSFGQFGGSGGFSGNNYPTTTRRPSPSPTRPTPAPTLTDTIVDCNNPFESGSDKCEAEAPPGIFENTNIKLTTRAPLTTEKPDESIDLNVNPDRNANRRPRPRPGRN